MHPESKTYTLAEIAANSMYAYIDNATNEEMAGIAVYGKAIFSLAGQVTEGLRFATLYR